jgi:hypothetical protein
MTFKQFRKAVPLPSVPEKQKAKLSVRYKTEAGAEAHHISCHLLPLEALHDEA